MADWDVVSSEPAKAAGADPWAVVSHAPAKTPKDYDPWPADQPPPDGFHVVHTNGPPYLVHDFGLGDATRAINDLPGVGMAAKIGQGVTRLAGKAASGIAGIFGGGPDAVEGIQHRVNAATELPESHDPLVQGMQAVGNVASKVAAPIDNAVGNLPAGPRTAIEATEEAIPDLASLVPGLQGARVARAESAAARTAPIGGGDVESALTAAGYKNLPRQAEDSTAIQRGGSAIAGEGPLAQQQTLTNQGVTDELARGESGVPQGQKVNYQTLLAARNAGPAKVYNAAHGAMPETLQADPELTTGIQAIGDTTSQLPRSPDVDALKQTMLSQPQMTRDQLFSNIQQARERASRFYAAEQPDSEAMGDAYSALANSYEDFVGRQLGANKAPGSPSLQDWQNARVAFAKNYTVQSALKGQSVDASKIANLQRKNPSQLTGGLQLIAEQHNRFPLSTGFGPTTLAPDGIGASGSVPGMVARHATGPAIGAATAYALHGTPGAAAVGGATGLLSSAGAQGLLRRWLGGNPEASRAAATAAPSDPRLGYFFDHPEQAPPEEPLPPGIAGLLPAPPMVNAGGGATTPNILSDLGLSPDVQAAGPRHPGAPREPVPTGTSELEQVPARPMGNVNFAPQGDFSGVLQPNGRPPAPAQGQGGISLADLLSEGVEQKPPQGLSVGPMGAPKQEGLPFQLNADHMAGDLQLNNEPSLGDLLAELHDYAAVKSQGVPEGITQRTPTKPKGAQATIDFPSGVESRSRLSNNASGQTDVSQEFANWQGQRAGAGVRRLRLDNDGNPTPLNSVDARDPPTMKGKPVIDVGPNGKPEIVDRGGLSESALRGLLARFNSNHGRLGDVF